MKRPVAFAALCYAAALAVFFSAGRWGVFAVAAASFLFASAFLVFGKNKIKLSLRRAVLMTVCVVFAFASFSVYQTEREKAIEMCTERAVPLRVVITSAKAYPSSLMYKGNVISADGKKVRNVTARFFSEGTFDPGDEVILRGTASVSSASSGGGNIDLNCEKIPSTESKHGLSASVKQTGGAPSSIPFEIPAGPSKTLVGRSLRLKQRCREHITDWLGGQEGALCVSLITGDRTLLSDETVLNFEKVGISHILAVSGLHVSVLLGILFSILKKLKVPGTAAALVMAFCAFFISLFYGFTPSVIRACIMAVIGFAAGGFARHSDPLTSMSAAAFVILLPTPGAITGSSFLLSFGCCFALVAVVPEITERLDIGETAKKILSPFILTLSVNIVMLPLLMMLGMNVSVVAVLAGPAAVLLVSWLMPLLPVFIILSALPFRLLPAAAGIVCGILSKGILMIADFFSGWKAASLAVDNIYFRIGLCAAIVLAAVFVLLKVKKALLFSLLSFAVCLSVSAAAYYTVIKDKPVLTVYDSNTVIITRNRHSSVIFFKPSSSRCLNVEAWLDAHLDYSPEYVIIPESGTYGIQNVADSDYYTNSIIASEPDRKYPFSFKDMDVYMINGDVLLTYNDIKIVFNKDDSVDIPGGTAEMAVLFGEEGYDIVLDGKLKSFGTYDTVSYLLKDNELRRIG